ncbi:MAG: type III-B CRISPR module RAMP protein Cmr1 [Chloroflexus sp.]|uniref:type III-B CRISPR module RAMP protein Cmr1 n=1 Tax=Chloroflexus sp. TaxID=1904827 RepID=UPI0040498983
MELKIATLTPLWTGGIDGKVDRIHETGILGSLRWWYEAIVRGLGGEACDPSAGTCRFDVEQYKKSQAADERQRLRDAGLCDVCQVFGATGWRRRFRVSLEDHTQPIWTDPTQTLNVRPPGRNRGWYLGSGRMGKLILCFQGEQEVLTMLAALMLWLECWGSLGSRPQLGYGRFQLLNREEMKQRAANWKWTLYPQQASISDKPDLRRFAFFTCDVQPSQPGWWTAVPGLSRVSAQIQPLVTNYRVVPITPALKNEWRFKRWDTAWGHPNDVFGTLHPDRKRGRVAVSWAYEMNGSWQVHGWAWMPDDSTAQQELWNLLRDQTVWRDVNLAPKNLVCSPHGTPWHDQTSEQVLQFLQEDC